jgi:hypothetical protein
MSSISITNIKNELDRCNDEYITVKTSDLKRLYNLYIISDVISEKLLDYTTKNSVVNIKM